MTNHRLALPWRKRLLARGFEISGLNRALFAGQKLFLGPYARAVNYHSIPASQAAAFERQLQYYRRHFEPVGQHELEELLRGQWQSAKPGLILSFDDGHRNHAEIAAPLLEQYGFPGWFFLPVGFLETPRAAQREFALAHHIIPRNEEADQENIAMSWDQARALSHRHVIGCHTWNHVRLREGLSAAELEHELGAAKQHLEQRLERPVDVFSWVGGEEWSYSPAAAAAVARAGFRLVFMTNNLPIRPGCDRMQLQRTNIEAEWGLDVLRLQLSGFLDLLYASKRRRVLRLLSQDFRPPTCAK